MSSTLTTFRFDEKMTKTIEELKAATGASSKAEIVKRAVALYQVVQKAHQNGEKLILKDEAAVKEREIIIP